MPNETIEPRLDAIQASLDNAREAPGKCQDELRVHQRIENANACEIDKLKRHVAKLQTDSRE